LNEPNDDELTVLTKEEEAVLCASLAFAGTFSEYVKEMNPELWERAREYAIDCTQVDGVKFWDKRKDN